jgi:anti-sigma B factor antagonist
MAIRSEKRDDIAKLTIEGEMTIYTAAKFKDLLVEALRSSNEMEIDLSEVSEMDTAGLQLLLLLRRHAASANKPFRLIAHSDASRDVFEQYNIFRYFDNRGEAQP